MAAVIPKQEGSKKPGNRGVLKRTRQPDQLNISVKFQRSLQAQKGNLTGMRLSTKIEISTFLYTSWFVVATIGCLLTHIYLETWVWVEVVRRLWFGLCAPLVRRWLPRWWSHCIQKGNELFFQAEGSCLLRCCKGWGQVGVARGEKQIREAIRIELYTKHDKHVWQIVFDKARGKNLKGPLWDL